MPCYDHRRNDESLSQEKIDELSEWLCSVITLVEKTQGSEFKTENKKLQNWWETHKAWDLLRSRIGHQK